MTHLETLAREYIIVQRPNGLGRTVMPWGASYLTCPDRDYIPVIEKSAYFELERKLKIARKEIDELIDALLWLFQSHVVQDSAYFEVNNEVRVARDILIKYGKIKAEECRRE